MPTPAEEILPKKKPRSPFAHEASSTLQALHATADQMRELFEQLGAANPSFDSEAYAQVGDKAKKATPWH